MIWNSGHDERGRYSGGQPGDQDGTECCVRPWFSSPWDCVLRWPDQALAAEAAELGRHAAANDLIGYCQAHRNTFYERLAETGTWDPADIRTACEGDCCRDCTTVWQAVGERHGVEALKRLDPDPYGDTTYTGNARERYQAAGFQVLTGDFFTASDAHLLPGDCLLNERVHMAMQLDVGDGVGAGVWAPGAAASDSEGGNMVITSDGAAFEGGAYRVTPDEGLKVRDAPSLSGQVVAGYAKGGTVVLDPWCAVADGYVWGRYTGATSGKARYVAIGKARFEAGADDYLMRC